MNKELAIGVDVGGSHISCAAINLSSYEYLEHTHAENEVDNHASPEIIIEAWGETIQLCMDLAGVEKISGIGFAMPGPFDYEKGISLFKGENGKFEKTFGLDVPKELRKLLGLAEDFKIRFINDATAFAIGEDRFGMAQHYSTSLSITLGTGFGSAFIRDKMPVLEGADVPHQGCLWHLAFEDGIADDYFSTRGFLKRYKNLTGGTLKGVKDLASLANTNYIASDLFMDFGIKMGRFLKPWIRNFGCEVVVMGGNISNAFPLYREGLSQGLSGEEVDLKISELKETASMIGSAFLIDDSYYKALIPLLRVM
jgi:glucokinase